MFIVNFHKNSVIIENEKAAKQSAAPRTSRLDIPEEHPWPAGKPDLRSDEAQLPPPFYRKTFGVLGSSAVLSRHDPKIAKALSDKTARSKVKGIGGAGVPGDDMSVSTVGMHRAEQLRAERR